VLSAEVVIGALGAGRGGAPAAHAGAVLPLRDAERIHIEKALIACGWNLTQTSRALEISPTTLRKKIQDYGIKQ